MAQYEHLPLYKQAYSLLLEFHQLFPTIPKKYKFTLGNKIIDDITNGIVKIIETNSKKEKAQHIEEIIIIFEKVKIQIRMLKSLQVLSRNSYFSLSDKNIQILKQSEGWKK